MRGDCATSLSSWLYIAERNSLVDFVETYPDHAILVLTPQPPRLDVNFFTRPFRHPTLLATTVMGMAILVALFIPYAIWSTLKKRTAWRIGYFTSVICCSLINMFFTGAMTMFLAQEASVSFETIRDVMRDESWSLVVQDGRM